MLAISGLLFLAIGLVASLLADPRELIALHAALLSIGFALALASTSFAFVVFQLSAYRTLIASASSPLLAGALATVLVALTPLVGLAASAEVSARVSAITIPVLAWMGIALVSVALREGDAAHLIRCRANDREVQRYLWRSVPYLVERLEVERRLEDARIADARVGPPMHEIFFVRSVASARNSPLDFLVALASEAANRGDVGTYGMAIDRAFAADKRARALPLGIADHLSRSRVQSSLQWHVTESLARMASVALATGVQDAVPASLVSQALACVQTAADEGRPSTEISLERWKLACDVAGELLERGRSGQAIEALVVGRHAVEAGMAVELEFQEEYGLTAFPSGIAMLGERAIAGGDVDSLYRTFDALGWIACAAVRHDDLDVGRRALQGLVQLGRIARDQGLTCFWTRCMLTPADHVDERVQWTATWVPKAPEAHHSDWLESLAVAWSRLHGHPVTVDLGDSGEKPQLSVSLDKQTAYMESIDDNGRVRTIDYSDPAMLKEMVLR